MNRDEILNGAIKALVDRNHDAGIDLKPSLIFNDRYSNVLSVIETQLRQCDEFRFSTAFITEDGIKPLLIIFRELEKKNIKGKILTTDYLYYTDPKAVRKLNSFENITVKFFKGRFHTKGYLFSKNGIHTGLVGSSNLTGPALSTTKEWNIGFTSTHDGELLESLYHEFDELWDSENTVMAEEYLPEYEILHKQFKIENDWKKARQRFNESSSGELKPNSMQVEFLDRLDNLMIERNESKALLVSATGTGKTYASAFAVKKFRPKKFLFLVHRQQIAEQSLKTYRKVFNDPDISFGILGGGKHETDADFLFSTFQSMNANDRFKTFGREEFDYIVVDEVHRAAADTYSKIIEYFNPKFLLGMSATPWRTDNKEIFGFFDDNIVYHVTLKDALEEDLLCPFHYYGISDLEFEGQLIDEDFDKSDKLNKKEKELLIEDLTSFHSSSDKFDDDAFKKFNFLTSDERVRHILEQSEFFGYSGDRIKALVFCSSVSEAKVLAKKFNEKNHPSLALDANCDYNQREKAIERLTEDNAENKLEYLFTYDIFNEGVDIPQVNQVILARPTKSPIVFVQQLGRGLRKFQNKEYVVVLDFIGNYKNNYMIPIALSGIKNHDKDTLRTYLTKGNQLIPGMSSISFDSISRKQIYKSIDDSKLSQKRDLKESYHTLKRLLGGIPSLCDIQKSEELDAALILGRSDVDCYYSFLLYADKEYKQDYDGCLGDEEISILKFISKRLSKGVRPHELLILKYLIYNKYFTVKDIFRLLHDEYGLDNQVKSLKSALNYLNFSFFKKMDGEYHKDLFNSMMLKVDEWDYDNLFFNTNPNAINDLKNNLNYRFDISNTFKDLLASNSLFRDHLEDLIDYSLIRYQSNYSSCDDLKLYGKYTTEDVMMILNWSSRELPLNIGGYREKDNECAIFVTYEKNDDRSESTRYPDAFIDRKYFSWMSRSNKTLSSDELQPFIHCQENDVNFHLFVQKSKNDTDYYYMGRVTPEQPVQTTISGKNDKPLPIVNFKLKLHELADENLYNYFITNIYED